MLFLNRYETIDRSQLNAYNDSYSNLVSPEKVNTLERNKKEKLNLLPEINAVDSAVYGLQNSYNQNSIYNSVEKSPKSPVYDRSPKSPVYDQNSSYNKKYDTNYSQNYDYKTESYSTFADSQQQPKFSTPFRSEVSTNYFAPESYKTDMYKYENIHTSKPIEEKGFSSTPNTKIYGPSDSKSFEVIKNGADHQIMSYSNVEYLNDPPLISEADSLEQRMCKQSVTQKIIEKKTVHMSSTSKHESSTKSYRFE